jgi:hypothetical protein
MEYYKKHKFVRGEEEVLLTVPTNGGQECDCWDHHCSCGSRHAWDNDLVPPEEYGKEFVERSRKETKIQIQRIIEYQAQVSLLRHLGFKRERF